MPQSPAADARAEQQYATALAAFRRGDNQACRRISEEALAAARAARSGRGVALSHLNLSRADFRDGLYASGIDHALAADAHAAEIGAADLRVTALHVRAEMTRASGDYRAAVPMYEELLRMDDATGDEASLATEQYNLGSVLIQTGELGKARSHLQRSLELCRAKPQQLPYTVLGYAGWLARAGDPAVAGKVLGAVEHHFEEIGEVLDPAEAVELESHLIAGRDRDPAAFDAGRRAGGQLSLAAARDLIESSPGVDPRAGSDIRA